MVALYACTKQNTDCFVACCFLVNTYQRKSEWSLVRLVPVSSPRRRLIEADFRMRMQIKRNGVKNYQNNIRMVMKSSIVRDSENRKHCAIIQS